MKKYILYLAFLSILSSACKKELVVDSPKLEIDPSEVNVKANSKITFSLKGNPDIISFYSGEFGASYEFVQESRKLSTDISLKFDSQILDGTQENQFAVMISSDFNGTYDLANIKTATWTDVTSRFRMATPGDNRVLVSSGEAKINDLIVNNKPIYIGLRYLTKSQPLFGQFNLWRVQNLLLQSTDQLNGTVAVMTQANGAWKSIQSSNYDANRGSILTNNITFQGNSPTGPNKDQDTEAWAISKIIPVSTLTDLGPDKALPIKSLSDPALKSYTYTYTKPGKYTAAFVAINGGLKENKKLMKQVNITVTP